MEMQGRCKDDAREMQGVVRAAPRCRVLQRKFKSEMPVSVQAYPPSFAPHPCLPLTHPAAHAVRGLHQEHGHACRRATRGRQRRSMLDAAAAHLLPAG